MFTIIQPRLWRQTAMVPRGGGGGNRFSKTKVF